MVSSYRKARNARKQMVFGTRNGQVESSVTCAEGTMWVCDCMQESKLYDSRLRSIKCGCGGIADIDIKE